MACLHAGAPRAPLVEVRWWCGRWPDAVPMLNILNGGAHAAQRRRSGIHGHAPRDDSFEEGLRAGVETYHSLKAELKKDGLLGGIGMKGFAPNLLPMKTASSTWFGPSKERVIPPKKSASLWTWFTVFKDDGYHMDGKNL